MNRSDYRPPAYLVDQIDLLFVLHDDHTAVTSTVTYTRNPSPGAPEAFVLDGDGLETVSVALDGRPLAPSEYTLTPTTLTIPGFPARGTLRVETRLEPHKNKALSGLYRSGSAFCTQCEAEGFRRITWYPDRPDVMATFRVRIEADRASCPVLLSNGNPAGAGALGADRHWAEWVDPFKKPSYLFALVAGDLEKLEDTFVTASGRKVGLVLYTEHGSKNQCVWALESLKRAMKWDEVTYGREYDLDLFHIVAVSDFNMGAMENKSLNIFNTSAVFATPEKSTDAEFLWVESVVAHEYFHNWTGNRITCRDWFQLTLKEGLTVFRDEKFTEDHHSAAVARLDQVQVVRAMQFPEDLSPMAHPIRPEAYEAIDNFYTSTVYRKGAEVIRMLATLLGPQTYRKATDLYFERHDGQAVTCDDFLACMADASGLDLTQFALWYSQAGTPLVKASTSWDQAAGRFTLRLAQSYPTQPQNRPVVIPVRLALDPSGADEQVLVFNQAEAAYVFEGLKARPIPSLLRGFSAPVNLETDLTDADLAFLVAHDSDGFVRFEASSALKRRDLLARAVQKSSGGSAPVGVGLISLTKGILNDPTLDPALAARLVGLPTQSLLEQSLNPLDPLALDAVLDETRAALAEALEADLLAVYDRLAAIPAAPGFPTDADIGRRALKNACLRLLAHRRTEAVYARASAQYRAAANLTDRLAALEVFTSTTRPERTEFLADFYRRFENDKLVIDEWYSAQASAKAPDLFEALGALEAHPSCDLTNPNRVRALYRAFVRANPSGFHEASGRGYRFLAAAVAKIDAYNPQAAAGLVSAFQTWGRFAEPWKGLQRQTLEGLAAGTLSANTGELVRKYLGAQRSLSE